MIVNSLVEVRLDIAGSARAEQPGPYAPKGATGVGVRTLLTYLGR